AGSHWRLCRWLQSRAAHRRHRPLRLRPGGARFRQTHLHSGLRSSLPCCTQRGGGDSGRGRRPRRPWPFGFDPAQPLSLAMDNQAKPTATDRLVTVTLDPNTITSINPDEVHEWRIAIFDLLEDNSFRPARVTAKGPFALHMSIVGNYIVLDVRHPETFQPIAAHYLSLTPFRRLSRDYFRIRDAYYEAIRSAMPFQIETVDMARRG